MPALAIVVVLCLGASALSGTPTASSTPDTVRHSLEALSEDVLRDIASRLPAGDHFRFSLASRYLRDLLVLSAADIISARLYHQFGEKECLVAALHLEGAPPGSIVQIVVKLLRSTKFEDSYVREALEQAYAVGHCDVIGVLSDHLQASQPYGNASCADIPRLASLPLADLLRMHALPRPTFLQVLAAKYNGSDYASFFKDTAWDSQDYSNTILSHAVHLYKNMNSTVDFEPVPFGHIAATQTISEPIRSILQSMDSSLSTYRPDRPFSNSDVYRHIFSHLQSVLSPDSEMEFFNSLSLVFRTEFLLTACRTGRLDWVKFMVNHELWNNVEMDTHFFVIGRGWSSVNRVMRFEDVLAVGDPVISAFEMVFHHQMKRLPCNSRKWLRGGLLWSFSSASSKARFGKKIVIDYILRCSGRR